MKLNKKQVEIYKSIMRSFPKTRKSYAMSIAIDGGTNTQFYNK